LTNVNNAISTLQDLQNGDVTSFQTIQDNFDTLDTLVGTKQDAITSGSKLSSNVVDYSASALRFVDISSNLQAQLDTLASQAGGNSIPSISYDSGTTTTTISDTTVIDTLKFDDTTEQTTAFTNTINTAISTNATNITTLDTRVTTAEGSITTNTNNIALKQNIINSSNKLNISNVDYSGSVLNYVDAGITQNISTSLSAINTAVTALQTSDTSQTTSISNLTSSVNNLTNNKQDIINGTNLVSSQYISYNASDVKTELDSINTSISSKANTSTLSSYAPLNNPTFTGTVAGITKSMVGLGNCDNTSDSNKPVSTTQQTALDLKANISAPVFTGYIQTPRIFENIASSYTSFTSNILTYDYASGSILYFGGLTSATNFQLILNNINPNNETYRSFTFSLIINTATYRAYATTFKIASTAYTLRANGGLANITINASSLSLIQTFTIVYTSSSSTPYQVLTSVGQYF
jgi:trimeric autotransporter adhesin